MTNTIFNLVALKILKEAISYFGVYEYLKLRLKTQTKQKIIVSSLAEFWSRILNNKLFTDEFEQAKPYENGQIIEFKDFFISDFAPKLPGQIWTKDGKEKFEKGTSSAKEYKIVNGEFILCYKPEAKKQVIESGLGSIRINPSFNNEKKYMYLSITKEDCWMVDFGIPLVVTKTIYDQFLRYSSNGGVYVEKLVGTLIMNLDLPFKSFIPPSIGSELPVNIESSLKYSCFLPKCYIYVDSLLDVKFKFHDSQPDCIAWTMFESPTSTDPYSFCYNKFNPNEKDTIDFVVDFFRMYVSDIGGKKIICDFDGQSPRLNAEIPLSSNPMVNNTSKVKHVIKTILNNE